MLLVTKTGIYHVKRIEVKEPDYYVTKTDYDYIYFNRYEIHLKLLKELGENVYIDMIVKVGKS